MANVYLQDSTLTAIGDAIRTKAGNTDKLLPSEMANAITNLPSGGGADELDVIKSMSPHITVAANGDEYLAEKGQSYGYIDFSTVGQIPLEGMGLQGYDNFMRNCIFIMHTGTYFAEPTASNRYSQVFYYISPILGSLDDRYVYVWFTRAHMVTTSATTVGQNAKPGLTVAWNRPTLCMDTTDGRIYNLTSNYAIGGSLVTPAVGAFNPHKMTAENHIYYKKRI